MSFSTPLASRDWFLSSKNLFFPLSHGVDSENFFVLLRTSEVAWAVPEFVELPVWVSCSTAGFHHPPFLFFRPPLPGGGSTLS
ncbi:hypothetical protein, partial [Xanthomonas translucens]|uniref:hypothetical protein n=1 Tax=Xanthomonas campestris pv. translucens TaxID=343 RepID=UPI0036D82FDE